MADKSISFRMSLEGSEAVNKQLQSVGNAGAKAVQQIQDAASGGSFASATASISKLGSTAEQAFAAAGAAAQKFGASTGELQRVDSLISAIAARSRASGASFAALAAASDVARGTLGGTGQAAANAGAGLGRARAAAAETAVAVGQLSTAVGITSRELKLLSQVARVSGAGGLGQIVSFAGGAGIKLGALAASVAALSAGGATLASFASGAIESAKALGTLSEVSGASFDSMSALQQAFGQLGVSAKTFQETFTNLFLEISAQAPKLALDFAGAADKAASSVNALKQAQIGAVQADVTDQMARGYIDAATGADMLAGIQRVNNKLAKENADINARNAARANASAQANNLEKVVELLDQVVQSGKQLDVVFNPLTTAATKAEAFQTELLKVQVAGGDAATAIERMIRAMSTADALNVGKAVGIPREVIEAIRSGTASVSQLRDAFLATGLAISELDRPELAKLNQSLNQISAAWQNFKNALGVAAAPIFNDLLQEVVGFGIGALEAFQAIGIGWNTLKSVFTQPLLPPTVLAGISSITSSLREATPLLGGVFAKALGQSDEAALKLYNSLKSNIEALKLAEAEAEKLGSAAQQGAQTGETATDKLIQKLKQLQNDLKAASNSGNGIGTGLQQSGTAADALRQKLAGDPFAAAKAGADQLKAKILGILASARGIEDAIWKKGMLGGGAEAQIWNKARGGGGAEADIWSRGLGGGGGGGGAGAGTPQAGTQIFNQIKQSAQQTAQDVKQIFTDLGTSIVIDVDFSTITSAAQEAAGQITSAFSSIDIASALSAQIDELIDKFAELATAAAEAARAAASAASGSGGSGGGSPIPQQARGGLFGGRGTGTSDSNLAWVSRGEHIMPARAVRQPGVLAFLEALRRSGGDLSRILDGMGRFALGGMVPRAIPAFANGGPVGSMSNVTIQFPGVAPITGLRASSEVVDQLHKAAALAQVRSGGRKPSRYS